MLNYRRLFDFVSVLTWRVMFRAKTFGGQSLLHSTASFSEEQDNSNGRGVVFSHVLACFKQFPGVFQKS